MDSKKKIVTMIGRRWFDKTYGNTYHTVAIAVDGKFVYTSPVTYGYDNQFLQTGYEWLGDSGYLPNNAPRCVSTVWMRDHFIFSYDVSDVARKRDL